MVRKALIYIIRFYHNILSPMKLRTCRFYPTCSEYAMEAIKEFGVIKGSLKTITRVLKCHPFHPGGYDPVK